MKRVGILVGREKTFPLALIDRINERGKGKVEAEFIRLGGVRLDEDRHYDIIIDRISHEVPFYRAFLKRAALEGTYIINNPFWWSADDKFFNYSLATKLGVAIPRTVLLPQKDYIEGITSESLRNLEFPLDWQGIVDYVGLPAIIKPFDGGGWKNVSRVNSLEERVKGRTEIKTPPTPVADFKNAQGLLDDRRSLEHRRSKINTLHGSDGMGATRHTRTAPLLLAGFAQ